jgi:catechol 2,3-dioxygenase-like lactoylglutathione lyase family enzyme
VTGIHHTAIVTADVERSMRFWRDGLGFAELFDHTFTGDWPTLFGATTDRLRSVFLGDPNAPDTGIVELVQFDDAQRGSPPSSAPAFGFDDSVRRVEMPAPGGKTVVMAVITAPDGVRVELIGPPE